MNIRKSALLFLVLLLSAARANRCCAQTNKHQRELDIIFQALKSKDYKPLAPLLAPNVKIGDLPQGMNDLVVPQVLAQLPSPVSYIVTGVAAESGGERVSTRYTYAGGATRPQSFLFDGQGKITDFDVLAGAGTATAQMPMPADVPERIEIPFELASNIIVVKATLNGREEDFLFDSGAPTLILNAANLDAAQVSSSGVMAQGVGGNAALGSYHAASFDWAGIRLGSFDAITMQLGHLEEATGRRIGGLIGYNLFKDYEVTFDYRRKVLTLVHTDAGGNVPAGAAAGRYTTVPFMLAAHIPVFAVSIGKKAYQMGLDCGAGSNLIYAKYIPDLRKSMGKVAMADLAGAGSAGAMGQYAQVKQTNVGNVAYHDLSYVFEDATLTQLNEGYGLGIDGLLGYEFLSKRKTSINFRKGEMRIYNED